MPEVPRSAPRPGGSRRFSPAFLERFCLLEVLGEGGMGTVYRARQSGLDRDVAIKFTAATDETGRARFLREGAIQSRLRHPHVLQVFDAGEERGQLYLVFEIVAGQSLSGRIAGGGPLGLGEAVGLASQVCSALACVHEEGVLHRDLKSDNVLLTADGLVKVCDFGLAISPAGGNQRLTEEGVVMGTPEYLAPEVFAGAGATVASDLYGLGCVLFEMLVGRPPYPARLPDGSVRSWAEVVAAHAREPVPSIQELRQRAPVALGKLVSRLLAKDPRQRPASAAGLMLELEAVLRKCEDVERDDREASGRATLHSGRLAVVMRDRATMTAPVAAGGAERARAPARLLTRVVLGSFLVVAGCLMFGLWLSGRSAAPGPAPGATGLAPTGPSAGMSATASPGAASTSASGPATARTGTVEAHVGTRHVQLQFDGLSPSEVGYGRAGSLDRTARIMPGQRQANLGGLESKTAYALQPVWPGGLAGPIVHLTTLIELIDGVSLQPGKWRAGHADWVTLGQRLHLLADEVDDRPVAWRWSDDAGQSWSERHFLPVALGGTRLHVATDGKRLCVVRTDGRTPDGAALFSVTRPDGRSWGPVTRWTRPRLAGIRGLLLAGEEVDVFLVDHGNLGCVRYSLTTGRSSAWQSIGRFDLSVRQHVALGTEGSLHLVGRSAQEPRCLVYSRRRRGEVRWSEPAAMLPGRPDCEGPILASARGGLYVLWLDRFLRRFEGPPLLKLARSLDGGETWLGPTDVEGTHVVPALDEEGESRYHLVAAGDYVALAYHDDSDVLFARVVVRASTDRGAHFRKVASARFSPGKVMGARLRLFDRSLAYCAFYAVHETQSVVPLPGLVPQGVRASEVLPESPLF